MTPPETSATAEMELREKITKAHYQARLDWANYKCGVLKSDVDNEDAFFAVRMETLLASEIRRQRLKEALEWESDGGFTVPESIARWKMNRLAELRKGEI